MTLFLGWQYDALTAVIIAVVPLYIAELWLSRRKRKPGPGRLLAAVLLTVVWSVVVYGSFVEPRLLTVKTYQEHLGDSGRQVRIVVVGDFHLGPYKGRDWADQVVRRVNETKPDVVLLAGDFVSSDAGKAAFPAFRALRPSLGVWAVLGNHDYRIGAVSVRQAIEANGVEVLTNESVQLVPATATSRAVWLAGLDDITYGTPDWKATGANIPPDALKILACHSPDATPRAEVEGFDLLLSAHTHGGQIRLPFIGSIARLPTTLGQEYDQGMFDYGRVKLFISPGVGEFGPRARLFSRPEISVVDVKY